jgi:SAM-dependent methyltransferase
MKSVIGGLKLQYRDAASRNAAAQQQAIQNMHALLKPGGYLLTADNLEGAFLMRYLRARLHKNKGWHYFTSAQLQSLFTSFQEVSTRYFGVFPTKFALTAFNYLSFFFNKYLLNRLPASSKYIAFTIARK